MSSLDIAIAAIFVISIIVGMMRGFVREALSIASWVLAFWLGLTFCGQAGNFINNYISLPAEAFRLAAGFALVFIAALLVCSMISYMLANILSKGAIKCTDRVLGLGFGVIRAIAVMAIIVVAARGLGMPDSDWWKSSQFVRHFEPAADLLEEILPEKLKGFRTKEEALPDSVEAESTT